MTAPGAVVLPLIVVLALGGCASRADTPAGRDIEADARAFMAGYAADLLAHDAGAVASRYSRRGAHLVFPGDRRVETHETIARRYREGMIETSAFDWQDLAYEPISDDAILVTGAFRWESPANPGVLGTYATLLVREEGELRIRMESEFFDNRPPAECDGRAGPCDLPLDASAMARYTGDYEAAGGEGTVRVFVEEGRLMMQRPGGQPGVLLHEGGHAFRVEAMPSIRVVFDGGGERATSYVAFTGLVHTRGVRAAGAGTSMSPDTTGSYVLAHEAGVMAEFGSEIKAGAAQSEGRYTFTVTEKEDWGSPIHIHRTRDVLLYVLEGTLSLHLDGETHQLGRGAFAHVARGSPHGLGYYAGERTRVIHVFVPGGWEDFWLENSALGIAAEREAMPSEEYRRRLIEIAERYDTEFVAPNPFRRPQREEPR